MDEIQLDARTWHLALALALAMFFVWVFVFRPAPRVIVVHEGGRARERPACEE